MKDEESLGNECFRPAYLKLSGIELGIVYRLMDGKTEQTIAKEMFQTHYAIKRVIQKLRYRFASTTTAGMIARLFKERLVV